MDETKTAFVRVYHHSGLQVSVPLPADGSVLEAQTAKAISASVDVLLANGFTANLPGVVEGGDKTEIAAVVRGQGKNRDGGLTDRIWMYAPWGDADKGSQITVYLNTPDDTAAFEQASGLKVASMPVCKGNAAPRRESNDFDQFSRKVAFSIIRVKEDDTDSIAGYKWKLVQYVGQAPTQPPPNVTPFTPPVNPTPLTPATGSPASTERTSSNGESGKPQQIVVNDNLDAALDEALNELPPSVGKLDMIAILNRATKEKLIKNRFHFDGTIRLLLRTGQITHNSTADEVLDAIRRHKAEKELEKESA